ncbi:hypothetical protein DF146_20570 [Burkholderia cenocepacia]|uniref:hypothetical protein n=1 Tax=Burkholderia cenocepacia TaxID=95486 RepID=UPI000F5AD958|nr:hypothetical protein [Burkholderia cenocepacia]RQT94466.1 hypothetical protein DF165_15340 [Burkholderia cenocepacia]RQU50601.1 hypothetical protein DF146_20570 [Burkholderia cenocepacia]
MMKPISKIEAAARQLDAAIDLYFANADSLAVYTLAYASFKVLFDVYPHRQADGFAAQLDEVISVEGWKKMARPANFLKHADRDPNAFLEAHRPEQGMSVIGLATLLYRRITGDFTPKMQAFDYWVEEMGYEELGIEEVDENLARVEEHRRNREALRAMPHDQKIAFARQHYHFFLENAERLEALVAESKAAGLTATEMIDKFVSGSESASG